MERKTAVAAAAAISASLLAATVGVGANLGALGFARPHTATATTYVSANASPPSALVSTVHSTNREGIQDD